MWLSFAGWFEDAGISEERYTERARTHGPHPRGRLEQKPTAFPAVRSREPSGPGEVVRHRGVPLANILGGPRPAWTLR